MGGLPVQQESASGVGGINFVTLTGLNLHIGNNFHIKTPRMYELPRLARRYLYYNSLLTADLLIYSHPGMVQEGC